MAYVFREYGGAKPKEETKPTAKEETKSTATEETKPTASTAGFSFKDYFESQSVKNKQNALNAHLQTKPGEFAYGAYNPSEAVTQAGASLNNHLLTKPGEFTYDKQAQWDAIMNQILNRDKFSYDLNGDALYQQYKDQYVNQGQQAMMDTMGQAQAMTGGYGNSYAQSVGQQTYQGYLQQLNDRVPELYQLALDKYNQEGQDLYNKYGLFQSDYDTKYGQHRDTVADWNAERDYLTGRYDAERNWDYGQYVDGRDFSYGQHRDQVADWQNERNYLQTDLNNQRNWDYGLHRDRVEDDQRSQQFAYQQAQDAISQQNWQKEFELARMQADQSATIEELNNQLKAKGEDTITMSVVNSVGSKIEAAVKKALDDQKGQEGPPYINGAIESVISEAADKGEINEAEYNYLMDKYYGTDPDKW